MKKVILLFVLMILLGPTYSQRVEVNYSDLLAKKPVQFGAADTVLVIQNVLLNKGDVIRLEVNENRIKGTTTKLTNSESVTFDLKKIFKNKRGVKGKLFISENEFSEFSVANGSGPTLTKTVTAGQVFTGIAYWDALSIFSYIQSATFREDSLLHFINNYNAVDYTSLQDCKSW